MSRWPADRDVTQPRLPLDDDVRAVRRRRAAVPLADNREARPAGEPDAVQLQPGRHADAERGREAVAGRHVLRVRDAAGRGHARATDDV